MSRTPFAVCLCGKVTIKPKTLSHSVTACHCSTCRRWAGGPLLSVDAGADAEIVGTEHVKIYDSSDWAERGFCCECGSHLFYRYKPTGSLFIAAGLFGDADDFQFDMQYFIDQKPTYYCFKNKTKTLTRAQIFKENGE